MKRILIALLSLRLAVAPAWAMSNPGPFALQLNGADFGVVAAGTQIGTPVLNLAGVNAVSCQVKFLYGSGGTQTNVFIQTSLDQGQTFFDIANAQFTTANGTVVFNLSALDKLTTLTAPTNLALTANTTLDGILGDRLQAVVVSTGTYGGSTLVSVRCTAR